MIDLYSSPQDEYLQTATRRLTIEELHLRALDTRALYQEFWVGQSEDISIDEIKRCSSRLFHRIIWKNFEFLELVQRIVMVPLLLVRHLHLLDFRNEDFN